MTNENIYLYLEPYTFINIVDSRVLIFNTLNNNVYTIIEPCLWGCIITFEYIIPDEAKRRSGIYKTLTIS
jgi:hypothetical protein